MKPKLFSEIKLDEFYSSRENFTSCKNQNLPKTSGSISAALVFAKGICLINFGILWASVIYTRRVARKYGICWLKKLIHCTWLKKELSMVNGALHFFLNKTFLFVKIESWHFQHMFGFKFRETLRNFSWFGKLFITYTKMSSKCLSE